MDIIISVFAIYGLTWALQNAELLSPARNWIMRRSVFAFQLLSCSFCTGFHSGWIIYLLRGGTAGITFLLLWGLAGAAISYILSALVVRLSVGTIN